MSDPPRTQRLTKTLNDLAERFENINTVYVHDIEVEKENQTMINQAYELVDEGDEGND